MLRTEVPKYQKNVSLRVLDYTGGVEEEGYEYCP